MITDYVVLVVRQIVRTKEALWAHPKTGMFGIERV